MNIEQKRKAECRQIDCRYYELKCLAFYGRECTKQGGRKIPLMCNGIKVHPTPSVSKIKPKFGELEGWNMADILRNEG